MKKIEKLKQESKDFSIKEGFFTTISTSLSHAYIIPFAIAINSTNSLIAMLSSIPGLLGPLSQMFHSRLIEKYKRKQIVSTFKLFEIISFIPLIVIAIFYFLNIIPNTLPFFLLFFFSLSLFIAQAGHPAWFSWVGDLVDKKERGKWFAKRTFIFGSTTLIFSIIGALFLDFIQKRTELMIGFIILFILALIARIIALMFLRKQYEPKIKLKKEYYFSFSKFTKKSYKNNFGRFTIYRALTALAVNIASPFFAIYMLKELDFSYTLFMIVTLSQTLFSLLVIKYWGKFSDKFGNYEVLRINMILISIIPFLWIFSKSPIYLIFVPQLISGIAWAGFELATGNYIYDAVTPQKRALAVSYFNLFRGIGVFVGAGIGALLIEYIAIDFMNIIFFIFIISGITRIIAGLIMLPYIKEVRDVNKVQSSKVLKNLSFRFLRIPSFQGISEYRFKNNTITSKK